jgi:hypothetical protein
MPSVRRARSSWTKRRRSRSSLERTRRTRSEGDLTLEKYIRDLNKYIDDETANRIEHVLGKRYAGSVRLYKFPNAKCEEIKAYKVLEENKAAWIKQLLREIKSNEVKESIFEYSQNPKTSKLITKDIDFNALAIISHKLAEKFARDSGDFEVGPLSATHLVEFHTYAMMQITNQLGSLEKHTDDFMDSKIITMIWYLIKDKDVKGGNIAFYAPSLSTLTPEQIAEYYRLHGVVPPETQDREVKLNLWEQMGYANARENCVCLIFKGNVEHSPEHMSGTGERSAIVFQFIRIDKPAGPTKGGKKNTSGGKPIKY